MLKLNLKYIDHVSFVKSELTNFTDLVKKRKMRLGPDDVAVLVSLRGDQLIFVYGFSDTETEMGGRRVLRSQRWRIAGKGEWDPRMLANYASEVGIVLKGIQRFEQHYDRLQAERLAALRQRRRE
jgi:hypothetical protein